LYLFSEISVSFRAETGMQPIFSFSVMKKLSALLVLGIFVLASCSQKYTCPTYSKAGKNVQAQQPAKM
jgi:hypothetical protein